MYLINTTPSPKGPGKVTKPTTEEELSAVKKGAQAIDEFTKGSGIDPAKLVTGPKYTPPPELKDLPVGILGAGCAGLYTAMILDTLDIKYEILEGSGRHGGRVLTHEFTSELRGQPYQYFVSNYTLDSFLSLTLAAIGMRSHAIPRHLPHETHFRSLSRATRHEGGQLLRGHHVQRERDQAFQRHQRKTERLQEER